MVTLRLWAFGVVLAVALGAAACGSVRPWQRELLAHRAMNPDSRPEETQARTHMLYAREGARGAEGEAGGGCGCR